MKKLLYTLLAVTIIFSACEKEEESTSNNSSSSSCGTATLTVDGVNYSFNNPLPSTVSDPVWCVFSVVSVFNGEISGVTAQVVNYCSNNIEEWRVSGILIPSWNTNININQNYVHDPSFGGIQFQGVYDDGANCSQLDINSYTNISQQGDRNGSFKLISIDYSNETISGEFSFTAFDINGTGISKTISCTFSNLPALIQYS